jgi:hypothetical protein
MLDVPHELVLLRLLDSLFALMLQLSEPLADSLLLLLEFDLSRPQSILSVDPDLPQLLLFLGLERFLLFLHRLERLFHLLHFLLFLFKHGAHLLLLGCLLLVTVGFGHSFPLLLVELLGQLVVELQLDVDGVLQRDLGCRREREGSEARARATVRGGLLADRRRLAHESLLRGCR